MRRKAAELYLELRTDGMIHHREIWNLSLKQRFLALIFGRVDVVIVPERPKHVNCRCVVYPDGRKEW